MKHQSNGTANIVMAAVLAKGKTTVYNAAVSRIYSNCVKC
jgi:UDP-N-acetylglucosamine enolpyruvyl transferase